MPRRLKRNLLNCPSDDDSDEEVATPSRSNKRKVLSDSEEEAESEAQLNVEEKPSVTEKIKKKSKIRRCVDSSDEENNDANSGDAVNNVTPRAERTRKLEEMRRKVKAKRGVYDSSDEEDDDKSCDGPESGDDDDLPMFENEEELPEEAQKVKNEEELDGDLDDFVVEDDVVEMEEDTEEEEIIQSKKRSKRIKKQKKKVKKIKEESEEEEDSNDDDEEENNYDYANPYKEMDERFDDANIMDVLSKKTEKDKRNAKLYKKEMGKYQFSVRSLNNKAAMISNRERYTSNMDRVKTDRGFKDERNLDVKDEEYHDYVDTCLYGESVRIFPHTKKVSKYRTECGLNGCCRIFEPDETKIIGATKFDTINLQYMKKIGKFGKESFYYICYRHVPEDDQTSDEYESDVDD